LIASLFAPDYQKSGEVDTGSEMQFIAHRIFDDREELDRFCRTRVEGCHGVELDVREGADGAAVIHHTPVFHPAPGRPAYALKPLCAAIDLLAQSGAGLETLFLDVKSARAGALAARHVRATRPPFDVAFTCWRPEDVAAVRDELPGARVLYVVAPIMVRRAPKRLSDLWLCNSFPFLVTSKRFTPKVDKTNRHNINVRMVSTERLAEALPRGVDGLCVHRIFTSDRLLDFAEARDLRLAVYGLKSRDHPKISALEDAADYAIVKPAKPRKATRSLDRAA
jgi:glycerophosphoryl diester phosphodiesterase